MPIPDNQKTDIEIKVAGLIASAGSSAKNTFNTFHFHRAPSGNVFSKTAIDTAFQAAIGDKIVLALNHTWSQLFNMVRTLNDAQDAYITVNHVNPGAVAGDRMAAINAVFLLLNTGFRGKAFRGGVHLGPVSEGDTTAGTEDILNAGAITRFAAIASALVTGFTDANGNIWQTSVFSRSLSLDRVNPTTIIENVITAALVNKRVGRLKVREPKSVY
jgi:hypothetical protein